MLFSHPKPYAEVAHVVKVGGSSRSVSYTHLRAHET